MPVAVKEGIDYVLLKDDYNKEFLAHNKPYKIKKEKINGVTTEIKMYKCLYCSELIKESELTVEHIIPKTRLLAGILWNPNKAWNLGPCCRSCNSSKSNYLDQRISIGFRNKFLQKLKISTSMTRQVGKEGMDGTPKYLYPLMGLIIFLSFLAPIIIMCMNMMQFVVTLAYTVTKFILSKFEKIVKKFVFHPIKTVKALIKISTTICIIFILGYLIYKYIGVEEVLRILKILVFNLKNITAELLNGFIEYMKEKL